MSGTDLITLEQVEDVLLHGGDLAVVDSDQVQEDMIRRVLEASSLEEAFNGFKATPVADVEGKTVQIRGVAWMRSAFDEGPKVYALLDAVDMDSGEQVTLSMGGRTLMGAFVWAQRNAAMPFEGVFRRERSGANTERQYWTFRLA